MDAISGLVGLTAVVVAGVTTLGLFGRRVPRYSQIIATVIVLYAIAAASLLSIAQLYSLAAGNMVAGLIVAGLLIVTGATSDRARDVQAHDDLGRDDWGR